MGLHSVEELVTGKRSEGKESDDFQGGVYEAAVNQEKRDDLRSHSDSAGEQEVSVAALNTDRSGRLKLETVDDLFNILQLRKRRRERKSPVHKRQQPEPETVPETVDEQLFLTAAMENKLPVVEKFLSDGGNPNVCDHFQRTALHKAAFRGNMEVMKSLLEAGAAIEKKDKLEATALHWACRGGSLPALQLLLDQGAKVTSRDKVSQQRLLQVRGYHRSEVTTGQIETDLNKKWQRTQNMNFHKTIFSPPPPPPLLPSALLLLSSSSPPPPPLLSPPLILSPPPLLLSSSFPLSSSSSPLLSPPPLLPFPV
ncbi:unnamed protein product [Pleuronectes platessa]|uniref:Ankyrin repeat domain-containing protein 1 n=1 Tax=Pleuronectes platessa TaxID=8262 RepID=A0A9N7VU36_PLEPL|nr:unnamed protein product [Pleuronectes platessa]